MCGCKALKDIRDHVVIFPKMYSVDLLSCLVKLPSDGDEYVFLRNRLILSSCHDAGIDRCVDDATTGHFELFGQVL